MSVRDVIADALMNEGCGDSYQCERTADRVLARIRAAGFVVGPVEPTEEMVKAPSRGAAPNTMRAIYRTMIAAIDTPGGDGVE